MADDFTSSSKKIESLLTDSIASDDLSTLITQLEEQIDEKNLAPTSSYASYLEKKAEILELEKELAELKKESELLPLVKRESALKEPVTNNAENEKKSSWPLYQSFKLHPGNLKEVTAKRKNFLQEQREEIRKARALRYEKRQQDQKRRQAEKIIKAQKAAAEKEKIRQEKIAAEEKWLADRQAKIEAKHLAKEQAKKAKEEARQAELLKIKQQQIEREQKKAAAEKAAQLLKAQRLAKEKDHQAEQERLLVLEQTKRAELRAQKELLKQQIKADKEQAAKESRQQKIALEESKKNAREQKIKDWQEQLAAKKVQKQAAQKLKQAQKQNARAKYLQARENWLKHRPFHHRGWYVSIIRRPVIYLAGLEFLLYFFSLIPGWRTLFLGVFLPYLVLLDVVVFVWMSLRLRLVHFENRSTTVKCLILAGLLVGLARSFFKVIWIGELWTVFNLISESLIDGLVAGGSALIISLLISDRRLMSRYKNQTINYELGDL
ncbi:MAG TPA: hypothetical protein PKZ16_02240 [bacterium]|nr:hypothetical protein [bacterium]HPL95567.1 hypothetical protein [bacterium]